MRILNIVGEVLSKRGQAALLAALVASMCVMGHPASAAPKGEALRPPEDRALHHPHRPERRPERRPPRPAPRPPRYGYGPHRPGPGHGPAHRPHPHHRPRPHRHVAHYKGSFFELILDIGNLIFVGGTSSHAASEPQDIAMRTVSADIVPSTRGSWKASEIDGMFELKSPLSLPDDAEAGDIADVRPMFWGAEKSSTLAWYDASTSEVTIRGKEDPNFGTDGAELLRLDVVLNDGRCLRQDLALPLRELI